MQLRPAIRNELHLLPLDSTLRNPHYSMDWRERASKNPPVPNAQRCCSTWLRNISAGGLRRHQKPQWESHFRLRRRIFQTGQTTELFLLCLREFQIRKSSKKSDLGSDTDPLSPKCKSSDWKEDNSATEEGRKEEREISNFKDETLKMKPPKTFLAFFVSEYFHIPLCSVPL